MGRARSTGPAGCGRDKGGSAPGKRCGQRRRSEETRTSAARLPGAEERRETLDSVAQFLGAGEEGQPLA